MIKCYRHLTMLLLFTAAMMFTACENSGQEKTGGSRDGAMATMSQEPAISLESMEAGQHVVEFAALDFVFAGPSDIPSGWTTFRMPNRGEEHHVMILVQLPEGVSYADFYAAYNQSGARPDWWDDRVIMGGPAALAPGLTGETTVKLDPGEYAMACPVPTADGTPHSSLGMMRSLTGTEDMPEGYTAYFTADFEPGRYAFWCHGHSADGMVQQEFRVE